LIEFEIIRDGEVVYTFADEYQIVANEELTIILDGFIIQDDDMGVIISGDLSWSM
jgi:hypothetical protein